MFQNKIILFLIGFFYAIESQSQLVGSSYHEASQIKTANFIYVYNDVTDFAKLDPDGKVVGILVDLMKEFEIFLESKYGITVSSTYQRVSTSNFDEFLNTVKGGSHGVFGLSNASITEKRKVHYNFSLPFLSNISVLITHNSVPTLTSLTSINEEFNGMTAYSVPSSTYLDRLNYIKSTYFKSMPIDLYSSGQEVIENVAGSNKSFAVVDLLYYLEFFKKGTPVKRHKVGDEFGDKFGIIMPKNSDWKPLIDEFFKSGFIQSSKYRIIISSHLGASATRLIEPSKL